MKTHNSIDKYIAIFPKNTQTLLELMRNTITKAAPNATEAISYGIPTFKLNGKNLVHFGGFKGHISFFPTSSGTEEFKKELVKYDTSKGTIRFPLNKPLPLQLVAQIVKYRVEEVTKKNETPTRNS